MNTFWGRIDPSVVTEQEEEKMHLAKLLIWPTFASITFTS
jgi:hypothetical protein